MKSAGAHVVVNAVDDKEWRETERQDKIKTMGLS